MSESNRAKEINTVFEIEYDKLKGRGGAFLIVPIGKGTVFSRESFSEDQKMFESAALEFAQKTIFPVSQDIEKYDKDLTADIFKQMGELGFLGIDTPDEYTLVINLI